MWQKILEKRLEDYQAADLYRTRRVLSAAQSVLIQCDDKTCISFCSNDYLGLANHPAVVTAFKKGAETYGVGSGASQLVSGHSAAHRQLEENFAEFLNRDRALLFSTGYMANLGVISALAQKNVCVFADKRNHASLLDAAQLSHARVARYAHADMQHLTTLLAKESSELKLIVSDSVFSMDGDVAPLPDLAVLAKQQQAWLMVDDAHGIGVLGKNGQGALAQFNLTQEDVPILVAPLGKAFGCFGAIVAGSTTLIEYLIQFARSYIYTTAMPSALACAAQASLKIVQQETWRREKLLHLITYFKQVAAQYQLKLLSSDTPIQSLVVGASSKALLLSEKLFAQGFLVTAIRYPSVPQNTARLRITLSCLHEEEQIERFLACLAQVINE